MLADELISKFSKYIAFAISFVTLFVIGSPVSDPVNITKFLVLGIFAVGALGFLSFKTLNSLWSAERVFVTVLAVFTVSAFLSMILSESPITQNLYGVTGRNTGFLTFFYFGLLSLAILTFNKVIHLKYYVFALIFAGVFNIFYGFWVRLFGDFMPWTNVYGALLGTFGNPDFAGAFIGFSLGVLLSYFFGCPNLKIRALLIVSLIVGIISLIDTKTVQGILVAATTIAITVFLKIRSSFTKFKLHILFAVSIIATGIVSLFGIFQRGPLQSFLYKRSVSLRGVYWDAAINTGNNHIISGVGLDSFGDWYREMRSVKAATWFPGEGVISNVAHNIYLDMYASGGLPLLVTYLFLNLYAGYRLISLLRRMKEFDWIAVSLASLFFGYEAQALISINQIGIGIWGWSVLSAILVYERINRLDKTIITTMKGKSSKASSQVSKSIVLVPLFMLIGLFISLPPFAADAKFTNAINKQDLNLLEQSLNPGYFNPMNSDRLARAVIILGNSNLHEQAYNYAKVGVEFNPRYFDAWNVLYYAKLSTDADRKLALENMKLLDPNNRKLEKLK